MSILRYKSLLEQQNKLPLNPKRLAVVFSPSALRHTFYLSFTLKVKMGLFSTPDERQASQIRFFTKLNSQLLGLVCFKLS